MMNFSKVFNAVPHMQQFLGLKACRACRSDHAALLLGGSFRAVSGLLFVVVLNLCNICTVVADLAGPAKRLSLTHGRHTASVHLRKEVASLIWPVKLESCDYFPAAMSCLFGMGLSSDARSCHLHHQRPFPVSQQSLCVDSMEIKCQLQRIGKASREASWLRVSEKDGHELGWSVD